MEKSENSIYCYLIFIFITWLCNRFNFIIKKYEAPSFQQKEIKKKVGWKNDKMYYAINFFIYVNLCITILEYL